MRRFFLFSAISLCEWFESGELNSLKVLLSNINLFCDILLRSTFSQMWKPLNHFILHLHSQQITDCSSVRARLCENPEKILETVVSWLKRGSLECVIIIYCSFVRRRTRQEQEVRGARSPAQQSGPCVENVNKRWKLSRSERKPLQHRNSITGFHTIHSKYLFTHFLFARMLLLLIFFFISGGELRNN